MVIIHGEHRGQHVELEFNLEIAQELRDRNERIMLSAKREKMAAKYRQLVEAWDRVLANPELLNLEVTFADLHKEYINRALYSEAGFQRMFRD